MRENERKEKKTHRPTTTTTHNMRNRKEIFTDRSNREKTLTIFLLNQFWMYVCELHCALHSQVRKKESNAMRCNAKQCIEEMCALMQLWIMQYDLIKFSHCGCWMLPCPSWYGVLREILFLSFALNTKNTIALIIARQCTHHLGAYV